MERKGEGVISSGGKFINFPEFKNISKNEIIVTIEHCSQCQLHQLHTHHIEQKYFLFAERLKSLIELKYSMAKVHTKVLDSKASPHRIGAFEVQVCFIRNSNVHKTILYSKLQTRTWPNFTILLNDLRNPLCF
jgi:hypothetical protein